jgi:hypothetical protein
MDTIGESKIWSFLESSVEPAEVTNHAVRSDQGCPVVDFLDLAKKVAQLQFLNRNYVLLFRGQPSEHTNRQENTSLKPRLFRPRLGEFSNPNAEVLTVRYERLRDAERRLVEGYDRENKLAEVRVRRQRIVQWSILQHYEVCDTPLLDVTQSLRIAASFASVEQRNEGFLYVLGVPNLSGAITASAESGLQIVRLSSVCPPEAIRPHIQEGYLLGEYPEMTDYGQKSYYPEYEVDFGRRLVAKFRFNPRSFWSNDRNFPQVGPDALYPESQDWLETLTQEIKRQLPPIV